MSSHKPNDAQSALAFNPYDSIGSVFSSGVFGEERLRHRAAATWEFCAALFNARGTGLATKRQRALRVGARRLFRNKRVDAKQALADGLAFTLRTTSGMKNVIAMHDSSEINLSGRWQPHDAGPNRSLKVRGYILHAVFLIDADLRVGRGFVCADTWARSTTLTMNDRSRPAEQKESYKWKRGLMSVLAASPDAHSWIHVMDREGDVHENFEFAASNDLKVIVGARADKRVQEGPGLLWSFMNEQPVVDVREVEMTSSATGAKERRRLSIRAARVTLVPSKKVRSQRERQPVQMNVVFVKGEAQKQEWMLLTTCEIGDLNGKWAVFDNYRIRTIGEDGFKLLKTGLEIESRSVNDFDEFQRKIALLLPLATCLLEWRYRARTSPTKLASEHVDAEVLDAMRLAARFHRIDMPTRAWTILQVVECLAQLGGYEMRKDQPPGWITIWRGWNVLVAFRETLEFIRRENRE